MSALKMIPKETKKKRKKERKSVKKNVMNDGYHVRRRGEWEPCPVPPSWGSPGSPLSPGFPRPCRVRV